MNKIIYFENDGFIKKGYFIKEIYSDFFSSKVIIAKDEEEAINYVFPEKLKTKEEWENKKGQKINRGRRWKKK